MKSLENIILVCLKKKNMNLQMLHKETQISQHSLEVILKKLINDKLIQKNKLDYQLTSNQVYKIKNLDLDYRQFIQDSDFDSSLDVPMTDSDRSTLKDIMKNLNQFLNYCKKKNSNLSLAESEYFYFGSFKVESFTSQF